MGAPGGNMIIDAMQALASELDAMVDRPVTIDPRNLGPLPAVLVDPPRIEPTGGTMCTASATFTVWAVGLSGALAEFRALDPLVSQILAGLNDVILAEPALYVPYGPAADSAPCQAYRFTVERLIPW